MRYLFLVANLFVMSSIFAETFTPAPQNNSIAVSETLKKDYADLVRLLTEYQNNQDNIKQVNNLIDLSLQQDPNADLSRYSENIGRLSVQARVLSKSKEDKLIHITNTYSQAELEKLNGQHIKPLTEFLLLEKQKIEADISMINARLLSGIGKKEDNEKRLDEYRQRLADINTQFIIIQKAANQLKIIAQIDIYRRLNDMSLDDRAAALRDPDSLPPKDNSLQLGHTLENPTSAKTRRAKPGRIVIREPATLTE